MEFLRLCKHIFKLLLQVLRQGKEHKAELKKKQMIFLKRKDGFIMPIGFILVGLSFAVWIATLVILLTAKKSESDSLEKESARKWTKYSNIALIILIGICLFILYTDVFAIACVGLSIFCVANAVKLFKLNVPQSQNYAPPQQNYAPPQQVQTAPQPQRNQEQQLVKCPHCGGANKVGSYFCVHCANKI